MTTPSPTPALLTDPQATPPAAEAAVTDHRTPHLGLPLPNISNDISDDQPRLEQTIGMLDAHAQATDAALAQKADGAKTAAVLATKADASEVATALTAKADREDVYAVLTEVAEALAVKADKGDVPPLTSDYKTATPGAALSSEGAVALYGEVGAMGTVTPAPNAIPRSGEDRKLDRDWIPEMESEIGISSIILRPEAIPYSDDFLPCNGGYVRKTDYPDLYASIGNRFTGIVPDGYFGLPSILSAPLAYRDAWTTLSQQGTGTAHWQKIAVNPINGDVWAGIRSKEIRVLRGGSGDWTPTASGSAQWGLIVVNPANGDVWACSLYILKVLRGGIGVWEDTYSGSKHWWSLAVNSASGDVWAGARDGEIKVLRGGTGTWQSTGSGNANWYSIAVNPTTGDVWACAFTGEIKVLRGGTGTWQSTGSGNANWYSIAVNPTTGDVWACANSGEIKVLRGGTGSWQSTGSGSDAWYSIAVNPTTGDVWACCREIKMLRGGTGAWQSTESGSASWESVAINTATGTVYACYSGVTGEVKSLSSKNIGYYIKAK